MIGHERRDEIIAVVVARLDAQRQRDARRRRMLARAAPAAIPFRGTGRRRRRRRAVRPRARRPRSARPHHARATRRDRRRDSRPAPSVPTAPALGATIGANAETLRKRSGWRSAIVSAPWPPIEWPMIPCRAMSTGNSARDQRRQLLGHIGPHPVIAAPTAPRSHRRRSRRPGRNHSLRIVGHVVAARARVRRDEDQAVLGAGGAILALLGDVGVRAGQARQIPDHRQLAPALRLRRHEDREGHVGPGRARRMA